MPLGTCDGSTACTLPWLYMTKALSLYKLPRGKQSTTAALIHITQFNMVAEHQ